MANDMKTRKDRFEQLLDSYAVATYLSGQLLDSGLLEKKIKIGNDVDRINKLTRLLIPSLAQDLRMAQRKMEELKDPSYAEGDFFSSSTAIANAYFDELAAKGFEWEHSDLEDLFIDYKEEAEKEQEMERNRW